MPATPEPKVEREAVWQALVRLATLVAVGWLIAVAVYYVATAVFRRALPIDTVLFNPDRRFGDLVDSWRQAQNANPYIEGGRLGVAAHFPALYLLLRAARDLSRDALVLVYLGLTFGGFALGGYLYLRGQRERFSGDARWPAVVFFVTLLGVLCYPLLFAVERGNLDPLIALLLVTALMLARRERLLVGALLVAVASALKGYPLAWLVLWLKRRSFGGVALGLGATAALVLLPGLCFEGGVATTLAGLQSGLSAFHEDYVVGWRSAHFSADLINGWRMLAYWTEQPTDMRSVAHIYERLAVVWAAGLVFFALFVARSLWRELLAVVLVMLVFPHVTNDYKLVLLLPVLLAWLTAPGQGWRDRLFATATGLLMVPKHYFFIRHTDASFSCVMSPLLLVALSVTLWPTIEEREAFRVESRAARARLRTWTRFGKTTAREAHVASSPI